MKLLLAIWNAISGLFRRPGLPHPEEPVNLLQTVANTFIAGIFEKWFADYDVPAQYWEHWKRSIRIEIYDEWPPEKNLPAGVPAVSWSHGDIRHMAILARWLNPGVIAHEQAHSSYALLSSSDKGAFSAVWTAARMQNPLIQRVTREHPYALASEVEGHAEAYRYLGQYLPVELRRFYPRLF